MNNFNSIYRFATKRNGIDELEKLLFIIYFIVLFISFFFKNIIVDLVCVFIFAIIVFRFLSKNLLRREKENNVYLTIINKLKFKKGDKNCDYIFKKCNKCHTILRLPLPAKRGIKHVKCPKCKKRLTVFCLKKQNVEVVRKGESI